MADTPDTEAGRPARPTDDGVFDAPARELFAARRGQPGPGPFPVGRRAGAHVHSHVEYLAAQHPLRHGARIIAHAHYK